MLQNTLTTQRHTRTQNTLTRTRTRRIHTTKAQHYCQKKKSQHTNNHKPKLDINSNKNIYIKQHIAKQHKHIMKAKLMKQQTIMKRELMQIAKKLDQTLQKKKKKNKNKKAL